MLRVFLHLGKLRNLNVILDLVITFNDVDFRFCKKMVSLQQHGGRFIQKLLYQKVLTGGRGVQHDDQLLHLRGLPVFILLNERHVAIHLHSVIVEAIIKGIRINKGLLSGNCKTLQKLMEIRPLRTVIGKKAKKFSRLRPRLPSKRQLQTDLVRKLFPLFFLQTLCGNKRHGSSTFRLLLRRRRIRRIQPFPEAVIIHHKLRLHRSFFSVIALSLGQIPVQSLRAENSCACPKLLIPGTSLLADRPLNHRCIHRINHGFRRDIAAEIPQLRIIIRLSCKHMAEKAVQQHVQITPLQPVWVLDIFCHKTFRIETDKGSIGSDRRRGQIHDR